jgi:hypothetical protein
MMGCDGFWQTDRPLVDKRNVAGAWTIRTRQKENDDERQHADAPRARRDL